MKRTILSATAMAVATAFALPAFAEKSMSADIAIIGGGLSGLAAGVQAIQGGAKVIVLEKQAKVGGTGNLCEGFFAAESKLQKRIGINVSKDAAFKMIMEYSHWKANGALAKAFVDKSAQTLDWMEALGIKYEYVGVGGFGGPLTWHVVAPGPDYPDKDPKDFHCARVINVFNKFILNNGGTILTKTPGTGLITEGNKVVGVKAKSEDGEDIKIAAKAVVVATGGFANNKEMIRKYAPEFADVIPVGNIGKEGDGIRMSEAAGASLEGMPVMQLYRPGLPGFHPADQMIAAAVQPYFWVAPNAQRYTDESNVEFWPSSGNSLARVGGVAYSIYDDATRKHVVEDGIEMPLGEWVLQGTKLTKWEESFNKELARKRGFVFKANSLDDLAKQIGIDPVMLKASVERMNKAVANRVDDEFNKNPKFLRPIATPPFYATKLLPRMLGTLGGVRVTAKAEAVDAKGVTIPGLYAVGTDAGGLYGDTYDLLLGGSTAGFAVNTGRIAAENALIYAGIAKAKK